MSPRLKSITVEDLRSIRGKVTISLDAPVVLIHGHNGTGKTSLLSALELALTGAVPTLKRVEPDYLEHLPHKLSSSGQGRVTLEASGLGPKERVSVIVTKDSIAGSHLLDDSASKFFNERCYLAQSTLGRLLEIYQHQDTRKSDSPLTQFVKELLALDQLDALIDGLHTVGHVNRLRDPVPSYWSARQDVIDIGKRLGRLFEESAAFDQEVEATEAQLRNHLAILLPKLSIDLNDLGAIQVALGASDAESRLQNLAAMRRDLRAISDQAQVIAAAPDAASRQSIEQEDAAARAELEVWQKESGANLDRVIDELRQSIPGLHTQQTASPSVVRSTALAAVERELARIDETLERDNLDQKRSAELQRSIEQGRARTAVLDQQILDAVGANEGLAQALSNIAPHIHGDNCPVCGRDFKEVSANPLSAHLSSRIATLVETSGRLQTFTRDRAATGAAVSNAERELAIVSAKQISSEQRDALKEKRARFDELRQHLDKLQRSTELSGSITRRADAAAKNLANLHGLAATQVSLRDQLEGLILTASLAPLALTETLEAGIARVQQWLIGTEVDLTKRQDLHRTARELLEGLRKTQERQRQSKQQASVEEVELQKLNEAKFEAERRIDVAKDLAREAREVRTDSVRRVFNNELNAVWRDLFVRLAPDENFVPAFAIPESSTGPVEAVLETIYRAGGKGGNPRAMLSAGNLNTAALTLFLALHLSVKPILPWLIIDDPVQSMDEVHVAQFAALLRTLAKQKERQIIIAVHERPLFEYLTLELSPSFLDDRLITVDLGRTADEMTTAVWTLRVFETDRAIAA